MLTNKYAEGYPGRRYYGGCQYVDVVEELAIARAKKLFCEPAGVEMAVNAAALGRAGELAAYFAVLEPGDVILGFARRRRAPDARHAPEPLRPLLPGGSLRPQRPG